MKISLKKKNKQKIKQKKKNKPKTKRPKNKNDKKSPPTGVEPQTINMWSQCILYCAMTTKVKNTQTLN